MSDTTVIIQDTPTPTIVISGNSVASVTSVNIPSLINTVDTHTTISSIENISNIISSGIQGPTGAAGSEQTFSFISNDTLTTQPIDSFSYTVYGAVKYIIYATSGVSRQVSELLIIHDNSVATLVEYANIATSNFLASFTANISASSVQLMVTPSNINTNFKIIRTLLPA